MMRSLLLVSLLALLAGCSSSGSSSSGGGSCSSYCPAVVAAHCPNGPANEADCEQGCSLIESKCGSQFNALKACAGSNPTFSCDPGGFVTVAACKSQYDAVNTCAAGH